LALAYQFTNYFNIYFLIVTFVLSIKDISGMEPGVGIGPFSFVIGIALIREAIEDLVNNIFYYL
jgi:phospholipid-transporting ATPase